MNKTFTFIKKHFLTKKFLSFGIIGVFNTAIDSLVYYLFYTLISAGPFWSKATAFITASLFSYFANVIFTFKPKTKSTVQFSIVMIVYLLRLLISSGLTTAFDYISINWLNINYETYHFMVLLPSLLASALLIPIAYFALDWVFRKTDTEKE